MENFSLNAFFSDLTGELPIISVLLLVFLCLFLVGMIIKITIKITETKEGHKRFIDDLIQTASKKKHQ